MEVISGPAVVLDEADCAVLGRQLADAINWGWLVPGRPPPAALVRFADEVNRVARSSARLRPSAEAPGAAGTGRFRGGPDLRSSDQPAWLTTAEAARLAGVSTSYVRRLARERAIEARRDSRGAYEVSLPSVAAWTCRRSRTGRKRRKAA